MMLDGKNIGFIGGGNMARAIGFGLLRRGIIKNGQTWVSAPSTNTLDTWKSFCVNTTHDNYEVFEKCDVIILACKPHQLSKALKIGKTISAGKLYVSILVGVPSETVSALLKENNFNEARVIRVMPNVAVAVGEGCSVLSCHSTADAKDIEIVREIFSSLGRCEVIPENLMESVAAVCGSGPAYIFMVIEAMADGAVKHGVPRELAYILTSQTVAGAAKLVLETNKHPGQLKDEVCSPGGTTVCAVHELEKGNLRGVFMNAIESAVLKAKLIASSAPR